MIKKNRQIIKEYYQAMHNKNIIDMSSYLHSNISFQCPFTTTKGKESFVQGVTNVLPLFESLKVRACLSNEDEAVVIYDLHCPAPINTIRIASFLKFTDNLISSMELFYDARPISFS